MSRRGGGGGGTAANGFQQGFDPDELFNMFFGSGFQQGARCGDSQFLSGPGTWKLPSAWAQQVESRKIWPGSSGAPGFLDQARGERGGASGHELSSFCIYSAALAC